ncbi:MAG: nucleotidyltransferase [Cyclobacteriaceae bacterium]
MADLFNEDFVEYIQLLNKYEVEYVLLGGMAVNLHGYRRSTGDMDLFVNPTEKNHSKMEKVHSEFGMMMGEMDKVRNFTDTSKYDVYTFGVSPVQIDVMTACKGITFDEAYKNSERFIIDKKTPINVVEYHVLVKAKKAANRSRDIADIEELEKVKKLGGE